MHTKTLIGEFTGVGTFKTIEGETWNLNTTLSSGKYCLIVRKYQGFYNDVWKYLPLSNATVEQSSEFPVV